MEAFKPRILKSGAAYDHLFPRASGGDHTVRRNASLDDTMAYIPEVVGKTLAQTRRLAAMLKGKTVYETCKNLWQFVYEHIQYRKDRQGYEQVRSPARTWHDRRQGVDCDCYSVFISSVLTNLGIPHTLRITKYKQAHFQHIYPIVPDGSSYITMDCVTDSFDYEVPYSQKKDYPMELQFLDGVPNLYSDANDLYLMGMDDDLGELGKILRKNMAAKKIAALPVKATAKKPTLFQKIKAKAKTTPIPAPTASNELPKPKKRKFISKVLNKINKINPATVLLRNGVLASMKLNVKNVASRLRWSYLTPQQAAEKNIDPEKFKRLVATRQKLESIFYGAGGKPENLKKAILGGKGNKDKAVNGLGMLPQIESLDYMDAHTPLQTLLGADVYYSENVEGMEGFAGLGELGEPLSLTSVAAAAGVIAGIVGSLKQIGDIFKSKSKGSEDFSETKPEEPSAAAPSASTPEPAPIVVREERSHTAPPDTSVLLRKNISEEVPESSLVKAKPVETGAEEDDFPLVKNDPPPAELMTRQEAANTDTTNPSGDAAIKSKPGFWEKNKTWLKPTAIVGGSLAVIAIGYYLAKPGKQSPHSPGLSGLPRRKKKKNHHRKEKHKQKIAVALL
jgi:hypothetical protein